MGLRKIISILTLNDRGLAYAIEKKRKKLSHQIGKLTDYTVRYGPFKGMKLPQNDWWGGADKGAMLLGIYEKEIQHSIVQVDRGRNVFIDLGAADGFYSIGMLMTGRFEISHAFEMSKKGREIILENAKLNGVSDKVIIHGIADSNFDQFLSIDELERAVILIDIEGGEFDILNPSTLQRLSRSIIFIELHDWFFSDGESKLSKLLKDIQPFFKVTRLTTKERDMSIFPELSLLDDSERWLLASEGRNRLMSWLRLEPI